MANVNGVLYTLYASPSAGNIVAQGLIDGELKVMIDSYETSTTTAGTNIRIGHPLQTGNRIVALIVACDDLGTGVTLDAGYIDADGDFQSSLFDGLDVASAALGASVVIECGSVIDVSSSGTPDAPVVDSGMGYMVGTATGDNVVVLSVQDASATGTIKVAVLYTQN